MSFVPDITGTTPKKFGIPFGAGNCLWVKAVTSSRVRDSEVRGWRGGLADRHTPDLLWWVTRFAIGPVVMDSGNVGEIGRGPYKPCLRWAVTVLPPNDVLCLFVQETATPMLQT
jgi:hypothetical protein